MSTMTHDDFLEELAELDPARLSGMDSLAELLTPDAAAHARKCADCVRTAEALLFMGRNESALCEAPPETYWQDFNERLSTRLESVPGPRARRTPAWPGLLRAAAVLVVVAALGAFVMQGFEGDDAPGPVAEVDELEEALAAWSEEPAWALDTLPGEVALALPEPEDDLPALLASPDDALLAEWSLELDDAEAAELARRLRAEISS